MSDGEGLSAFVVAALAVGGVVALLLLLGGASHYARHRKERSHASRRYAEGRKAQPVKVKHVHESTTAGDEVQVADIRPSQPDPLPPGG